MLWVVQDAQIGLRNWPQSFGAIFEALLMQKIERIVMGER